FDAPTDKYDQWIQEQVRGVHAAVVVAPVAYEQARISLRSGGKLIAVALTVEKLSFPIFETVLRSVQIIGTVLGTRQDMSRDVSRRFFAVAENKTSAETYPPPPTISRCYFASQYNI
ncbi:unnamed protein product, partial [Didymodactylos carnosus]